MNIKKWRLTCNKGNLRKYCEIALFAAITVVIVAYSSILSIFFCMSLLSNFIFFNKIGEKNTVGHKHDELDNRVCSKAVHRFKLGLLVLVVVILPIAVAFANVILKILS